MEFHLTDVDVDKALARFGERFHDESLEDSLLSIAKEGMDFALDECGEIFEDIMDNPERMAMVAMITSRWLCVQILTYREILAAAEGDGPTS